MQPPMIAAGHQLVPQPVVVRARGRGSSPPAAMPSYASVTASALTS
jgi:hypothetical protein